LGPAASGWFTGKVFQVVIRSSLNTAVIGASGTFTMNATAPSSSARFITLAAGVLENQQRQTKMSPVYTQAAYRGQTLYLASDLAAAGLTANEAFTAFTFKIAADNAFALTSFRIGVSWVTDTKATTAFWSTGIVYGPATVRPSSLISQSLITLPCNNFYGCNNKAPLACCEWDGVSNLVVEVSYVMPYPDSTDLFFFKTASTRMTVAAQQWVTPDSNTAIRYPFYSFSDGSAPVASSLQVSLRLTRASAMYESYRCPAAQSLMITPVPTVTRVTGPDMMNPHYGFYVASYADAPLDGVLQYKQYKDGTSATSDNVTRVLYRRTDPVFGRVWALKVNGVDAFTNAYQTPPDLPPGLFSSWTDVALKSPSTLQTLSTPFLISAMVDTSGGATSNIVGQLRVSFGRTYSFPLRALIASTAITPFLAADSTFSAYNYANPRTFTLTVTATPSVFPPMAGAAITTSVAFDETWSGYRSASNSSFCLRFMSIGSRAVFVDSPMFQQVTTATLTVAAPVLRDQSVYALSLQAVPSAVPGRASIVALSATYTDPSDAVRIELWQGVALIATIESAALIAADTSLAYVWSVSPTVPPGTLYRLKASLVSNSSISATSATFTIVSSAAGIVSLVSASTVSIFPDVTATVPFSQLGAPFNTAALCQRMQSLYVAADLLAAGLVAGAPIYGLALHVKYSDNPNGAENVLLATAWVAPQVASVSQTFVTTTLALGAVGSGVSVPASSLLSNRFVPLYFAQPLSTWDGASGLVLEYASCASNYGDGTGGVFVKPTSSARTTYEYSNNWILKGIPWPFVSTSLKATASHVMNVQFLTGCASSDSCLNGGACTNVSGTSFSRCVCSPGYFGPYCATSCDAATTCFGRGQCSASDGTCVCASPYTGTNCAVATSNPFGSYLPQPSVDSSLIAFGSVSAAQLQVLYTAAELGASGLAPGVPVSMISLQFSVMPTVPLTGLSVSFAAFGSATALTALLPASAFTVCTAGGTVTADTRDAQLFQRDGLLVLPLAATVSASASPLVWDGASSLVLALSVDGNALLSPSASLLTYLSARPGRSLVQRSLNGGAPTVTASPLVPVLSFLRADAVRPRVDAISPVEGGQFGATSVTLTGAQFGFNAADALNSVYVQVAAFTWVPLCASITLVSPGTLVCVTAPMTAVAGASLNTALPLAVKNPSSGMLFSPPTAGGVVGAALITYRFNAAPVLLELTAIDGTALASGSAEGGSLVRIRGSNLGRSAADVQAVAIGSVPCAAVLWVSTVEVQCTTAAAAAGMTLAPVHVTTRSGGAEATGSGVALIAFTYQWPSAVYVAAAPGVGNDTTCARNDPMRPCATLAFVFATFQTPMTRIVLLQSPSARFAASALAFAAPGMQLLGNAGSSPPTNDIVVDCGGGACFQAVGANVPLRIAGVTFTNFGATASAALDIQNAAVAVSRASALPALVIANCAFVADGVPTVPTVNTATKSTATAVALTASTAVQIVNCSFVGSAANAVRALTAVKCTNIVVSTSQFRRHRAASSGGAGGAVLIRDSQAVRFSACAFEANRASLGGAAHITNSVDTLFDARCVFAHNVVGQRGGAILVIGGGSLALQSATFRNNSIAPEFISVDFDLFGGGAIYAEGVTLTLSGACTFDSNSVANGGRGGAIRGLSSTIEGSGIGADGSSGLLFVRNRASGSGGAISLEFHARLTITGPCMFANNSAIGGTLQLPSAQSRSSSSTMSLSPPESLSGPFLMRASGSPAAPLASATRSQRAALEMQRHLDRVAALDRGHEGKTAPGWPVFVPFGAGLSPASHALVSLAACNSSSPLSPSCAPGAGASSFMVTGYGGGVYAFEASEVVLVGNDNQTFASMAFVGNAADYGGGLYAKNSLSLKVQFANFESNVGTYGGGGLACVASALDLSNAQFVSNSAPSGGGGGLYTDNTGPGGSPSGAGAGSGNAGSTVNFVGNQAAFGADLGSVPAVAVAQFVPRDGSSSSAASSSDNGTALASFSSLSGAQFERAIRVQLFDSNGRLVVSDSQSLVRAVTFDAGAIVAGVSQVTLTNGAAVFAELNMAGQPGQAFSLAFQIDLFTGSSLVTPPVMVTMLPCTAGQHLDPIRKVCTLCTGASYSRAVPVPSACVPCPPLSVSSPNGQSCMCELGARARTVFDPTRYKFASRVEIKSGKQNIYRVVLMKHEVHVVSWKQ
jgi:hypothetical protein